ncbi:MAG: DUF3370 family protein [Cyanobium sp.]
MAQVALLGAGNARPLGGQFNTVAVLHSNQPEEVAGPGILVDTRPGSAIAAETGEPLANATYLFNGAFGLHVHHKYDTPAGQLFAGSGQRRDLHLAAVLFNPGQRAVRIRLDAGAVRNSFEAPYLGDHLMGVKPLGQRPWNTGPGDATAVQLLRERLDPRLSQEIVIPPRERLVLFSTRLPALGVANALMRGHSDGPFEIAVVAAPAPGDDASVLATLDAGRLAPGRTYLDRIGQISNRQVFARVAGVALGDGYHARISHDLEVAGPLHVPLTSTGRTTFGSGEVQVNPLLSRMVDSSLDNVGTYGVRFDIDLDLRGQGAYALMFSHPRAASGKVYVAFRGSMEIVGPGGRQAVHVGLRAGESLRLAGLQLQAGVPQTVRISLVYPADSTPGHLLSVISDRQLAQVRQGEQQRLQARSTAVRPAIPALLPPPANSLLGKGAAQAQRPWNQPTRFRQPKASAPPASAGSAGRAPAAQPVPKAGGGLPLRPPRQIGAVPVIAPLRPPAALLIQRGTPVSPRLQTAPGSGDGTLVDRYRQAVEAQERMMRHWTSP